MQDKEVKLQREKAIKRGNSFSHLYGTDQWEALVELHTLLTDQWSYELKCVDSSHGIEKIALDRVRFIAKMDGINSLFREIAADVEISKQKENEDV